MEKRDIIINLINEKNVEKLINEWNSLSDEEKIRNKNLLIDIYKIIIKSNEIQDNDKDAVLDMIIYSSKQNENIFKMHILEFIKSLLVISDEQSNSIFGMDKIDSIISVIENTPNIKLLEDRDFINDYVKYLILEYNGLDRGFVLESILDISAPNSINYSEVIENFLLGNNSLVLNHYFFEKINGLKEPYTTIENIDEFIRIDSLLEEDVVEKCKLKSFLKSLPILIKKSNELNIQSSAVLKFIERISLNDNFEWENLDISNKQELEKLLFEYVMQIIEFEEKPSELVQNRAVIYFVDSVRKGNFSYINQNVFDNTFINIEEPDMSKYDVFIENGKSIPKESFENFVECISRLKLKNKRIPEKYYKYIIKESIYGHISKEEYSFIIQRALEDFAYDYLNKNDIEDFSFGFGNIDSDGFIEEEEKKIVLSDAFFYNYNVIETIDSIFHEITHAIQYTKKENLIGIDDECLFNKSLYNILKEDIILTNEGLSYSENYSNLESEFNARIQSAIKTNNFLKELGFSEIEIEILSQETIYDKIKKECNNNENRNIKIVDGKEKNINDILIELLNEHKDYMRLFPILNIEFEEDENGFIVKKSSSKIIEDYKSKINDVEFSKEKDDVKENKIRNLKSLYREILGDDIFYKINRRTG